MGVMRVCSCKKGLVYSVEKSRVIVLFGESLMLSVGGGGRTTEMDVRERDCAAVAYKFGARSVQDYEDLFCFRNVGTVARDDWGAVPEDAMSVTESQAEETQPENGLEDGGDGELCKLCSGFVTHV